MGLGYYLRNATEHVIFSVKGSPGPLNRKDQITYFTAKSDKHSGKPLGFNGVVEALCDGPYLELFARRKREGWTCWGDEVGDPLGIGFDPRGWQE
jgi:N6-adenosine-specific RNA methylase IME4